MTARHRLPEPAHLQRAVDYLVTQLSAARKAEVDTRSTHPDAGQNRQMVP